MKTTRILTSPLLLLSSLVLTACGGGSSSGSDDNTGGTGGGSTNTVMLTASVVQSTVCNTKVPASSAELVIYDNNWAIKSRHKADANGNISATIPQSSTVNISLIGTSGTGASRRIAVDSFAQHPIGDLGVYTIPGTSIQGCECQLTDVFVTSEVGMLYYGAQISGINLNKPFDSATASSNGIQYSGIEICRAGNEQWPTLYASTHSFEDSQAVGYLSEYDPTGPLTIVLDKTPTSYSANFDPSSTSASVTHDFEDASISHHNIYISSDIQLFDNLPGLTAISLRALDSLTYSYGTATVRVGRMQRHSVAPPYTNAIDVDLPHAEGPATLMQEMTRWLDSDDTHYDFSNISGFETFSISLTATLTDGSSYQQTFYGPKRGNIPDEVLPSDYGVDELLDEEGFSIYAGMLRYGDQQTYQQYLQNKTDASKLPLTERLLGNRSQFNQIYVDITR